MLRSVLTSALLCTAAAGCAMGDALAAGPGMMAAAVDSRSMPGGTTGPRSVTARTAADPARQLRASIWVEGDQDLFSRGDPVRLRFRTSEPAYAAVIHIDTNGHIELLYPSDPWDDGYIRGGREYSLPSSGWGTRRTVSGGPGIGYFYLLASVEPLDLGFFQQSSSRGWTGFGWQRTVRGDPFWAMQNLAEILIPYGGRVPYAEDVYTYHVGRRYPYPSYACYDSGLLYDEPRGGYYTSCDRLTGLLRQYPGYYDTRRYRGDRNVYWREIDRSDRSDPRHGYKERADLPRERVFPSAGDRRQLDRPRVGAPTRAAPRAEQPRAEERERARPVTPRRRRPTLERRQPEREPREPARPAAEPRAPRQPEPSPRRPEPRVEQPRPEPRAERPQPQGRGPTPSEPSRPSARRPGG